MEVVPLRPEKEKGPYDFDLDGTILRFQLDDCPEGVVVKYVIRKSLREVIGNDTLFNTLPEEMQKKVIDKEFISEHIHLTFVDKIFRISLKRRVEWWIKKQHSVFKKMVKGRERKGVLERELGI